MQNVTFVALTVPEIWRGSKISKVSHVTPSSPLLTQFFISFVSTPGDESAICMQNLAFLALPIPEIWRGSKNFKSRSRDPFPTLFDLILHFFP